MNNTFVKQVKTHTPANGCMAIWQRGSRLLGIVGLKF